MADDYLKDHEAYVKAHRAALGELLDEQAAVVVSAWQQQDTASASNVFDLLGWTARFADVVLLRNTLTATDFGRRIAARFDPGDLDAFLRANARIAGDGFTTATLEAVQLALVDEEPEGALTAVFDDARGFRLDRFAVGSVTTAANFGMTTGARQSGFDHKVWTVNSGRPRSSHAAMAGEQAPLGDVFSNGMDYPGDPSGGADENANCRCSLDFA